MSRNGTNEPDDAGRVSRRGFLKGAGLSAAGAALVDGGLAALGEAEAAAKDARVIGPAATALTLTVNGKPRNVSAEPRATLADVLRFDLGLTGTKVVCDRGSCSACTVWLDRTPVCACMTLVLDAVGRSITTIEGLAAGDVLHPVQQAFIEHDAMQCGFCTPGMVMSCAALLERNPSPTLDDVRAATAGNLCRCGTYPKVFDATLAAAETGAGKSGSKGK